MYNSNVGAVLGTATGTSLALTGHTFGLSALQFLMLYIAGFIAVTLLARKISSK